MFNLMAVTGRRAALRKLLAETEGDEARQAEAFDAREKLDAIDERLRDWETEVRLEATWALFARGVCPSTNIVLNALVRCRTRCDDTTTSAWSVWPPLWVPSSPDPDHNPMLSTRRCTPS